MVGAPNSTQNSQTKVVQYNHIIIKYQQPPDPAIINHVLELLIGTMRGFIRRNPAQVPYTQDYIDQIIPLLQTLYSQSAQWFLEQGRVPPPASNTIYLPPTYRDLQQLLSELHSVQTSSLGMMTHL